MTAHERKILDAAVGIDGRHVARQRPARAVDLDDRKLAWAKDFGATHTVNSSETDPVLAIQELTVTDRGQEMLLRLDRQAVLGPLAGTVAGIDLETTRRELAERNELLDTERTAAASAAPATTTPSSGSPPLARPAATISAL